MRNKVKVLFLISLITIIFTGCGMFDSAIPELDEDQEALVVEFATESLLKYDTGNAERISNKVENELIKADEQRALEEQIAAEAARLAEEEAKKEAAKADAENNSSQDTDIIDNTQTVANYTSDELETALGLDSGLDFVFEGTDIKKSYPENLDTYFVMNASQGCELLIIKYKLRNVGQEAISVDMPSRGAKFKIRLNGNSRNALTTMLVNDVAFYHKELQPGEEDDLVIVGEYKDEDISSIDSLSLVVRLPEGDKTLSIQ